MAVGLSAVNTANAWINTIRGTSAATFTGVTTMFLQCHTADPGSAGTTAVSTGIATRSAFNMNAASAGSASLNATASFSATGGDTITHISAWGASSAGTFYWSAALAASKTVTNGDTLHITAIGFSLTPIAA